MSRVGRLPIAIPAGVTVVVSADNVVTAKGPKGELVKAMHKDMNIAVEDNNVVVTRPSEDKQHKSLHGLTRALINNMIIGVEKGFQKNLELIGVGYRAQLQGKKTCNEFRFFTSSRNRTNWRCNIWNYCAN